MEQYLKVAIKAAKEAGRIAMENAGNLRISTKGSPGDIVTNADIEAEHTILSMLSSEFPDIGFISEEKGSMPKSSEFCWIVDPIDGTRNYSLGLPFFCTSIALASNNVPMLGVIYEPNRKEIFTAIQNKGAFLNGKRINVSKKEALEDAIACFSFYQACSIQKNQPKKIFAACRYFGAVALELAYIACGRLDFLMHTKMTPWDGAAGAIIVREAGGIVANHLGKPWQLSDPYMVASNPLLHKEFMARFPNQRLGKF